MNSSAAKLPVYSYYFSHQELPGAFVTHGADTKYLWRTLGLGQGELTQRISKTLIAYTVNFAATSNPNNNNLPHWPEFSMAEGEVMEFGSDIAPVARLHWPQCR